LSLVSAVAIAAPARAATIQVTTTGDTLAADGKCSLREATEAANTNAAVGGCTAGAGADTILLGPGIYPIEIPRSSTNSPPTSGDFNITGPTTVKGAGQGATVVDGRSLDRIFDVGSGVTATFMDLTLRKGHANSAYGGGILAEGNANTTVSDVTFSHNSGDYGGGLWAYGTLTIQGSSFLDNSSGRGGGAGIQADATITNSLFADNDGGGGGGLYINAVTVQATNVVITDNHAGNEGAGIENGGTLHLTDSTVDGNTADNVGGGIYDNYGTSTLDGVTLSHNHAGAKGGGIYTFGGPAKVLNSRISGNDAGYGAGILADSYHGGSLLVRDSTIQGNAAKDIGGGILNSASFDEPQQVTIARSLIAGNQAGDGPSNSGSGNGDGIYNGAYDTQTLENVTITGGGASQLEGKGGGLYNEAQATSNLTDVTLSGNAASTQAGDGGNIYNLGTVSAKDAITADPLTSGNCGGTLPTSQGHNLEWNGGNEPCFTGADPTNVFDDPKLGPLGDNGGPTETEALGAGSPAIDAGAGAPATDQRGNPRPVDFAAIPDAAGGDASDTGAFEVQGPTCQRKASTIVATPGGTTTGTTGADVIAGSSQPDQIKGVGGNDLICGLGGGDTLSGGDGNDTLVGGPGDDVLVGGPGTDRCIGGTGNNTLRSCER
jgi:CSLREA domain-containing protein